MAEDVQRGTTGDDAGHRGAGRLGVSDPKAWEADVVLRDGSVAHVRPISPDDKDALQDFHSKQSAESVYLRFFAPLKRLSDKDLARFTEVDQVNRVALVATIRGELIGIGRYDIVRPGVAEVAFNISDHHQGKGIGSVLLEHLAAIGQELGVEKFVADVLPQNRTMINVFRDAGYEVSHHFEDGVVALSFDIAPTEKSEQVRHSREHRSEAQSIARILRPSAVAVVGASPKPDNSGHVVLKNLIEAGYTGALHAVHPTAPEVLGIPTVRSVKEIGSPVDLVVIVVPAEKVLSVVDDCADAGVGAVLVMSGGFAESGEQGRVLQREVLVRARAAGMRVVGPHSYGVQSTDPAVRLDATPEPASLTGELGLFVQSGAVGVACLGAARRRGLGLSLFVSAGNRVDVSGNDVMQFVIDDTRTTVLGMHLETVGNPRKFSRVARELARTKPVIVVKSGQSGTAVPPGQTIRTAPVPAGAFDAMLEQSGVIAADSVHRMLDIAQLLVCQPLPRGGRVSVIGNTGALEAMTANIAVAEGLSLAHEPDLLAMDAGPDEVATALRTSLANDDCDAVILCYEPAPVAARTGVREAIAEVAAEATKPVLVNLLGIRGIREDLTAPGPDGTTRTVPVYSMPEDAVLSLAAAVRYAAWRGTEKGARVDYPDVDRDAAYAAISAAMGEGGRELTTVEVARLGAAYGITVGEPQPDGVDTLVTTQENPLFGPLVGFSLGGPLPELLGDIAYRIPPLTSSDVTDLVRSIRGYPLLDKADPDGVGQQALAELIGRFSVLADDFPELAHLEAPITVGATGAALGRVRVRVATPEIRSDADRRAMTI